MTQDLILIGGGQHASVVAEAAQSSSGAYSIVGYVDPKESTFLSQANVRYLGGDDVLADYPNALAIVTVGATGLPTARIRLAGAFRERHWATVVDRRAIVSPSAVIGVGSVIMAGAIIQKGARIGDHCIVNTGSVVEHDVVLENHVVLASAVAIGGGSHLEMGSFVGIGASIRDHVVLGHDSIVGMGAVVVNSARARSQLIGVPARDTRKADRWDNPHGA